MPCCRYFHEFGPRDQEASSEGGAEGSKQRFPLLEQGDFRYPHPLLETKDSLAVRAQLSAAALITLNEQVCVPGGAACLRVSCSYRPRQPCCNTCCPHPCRAYKVVCGVVCSSAGGLSVSNAARRRGRGGGPDSNAPRACQGQRLGRSLLPLAPRSRVLCSLCSLPPRLPRHPLRGVRVCFTVTNLCVEGG